MVMRDFQNYYNNDYYTAWDHRYACWPIITEDGVKQRRGGGKLENVECEEMLIV